MTKISSKSRPTTSDLKRYVSVARAIGPDQAVEITYPDGTVVRFPPISEAKQPILTVNPADFVDMSS